MTIIELAHLPLVEGADVTNADSDSGKVWQDTLFTVRKQDGFHRGYYGMQVESPRTLQIMFEWGTLQNHIDFTNSEAYGPFTDHVGSIMSGPIEIMFHIQFEPNFSDAASAPITEVATWYFPTSYDTHEWDTGVVKFNKTLRESAEGFHGVSSGWSIDDVPHKSLEDVGGKGKAFVLAVGWESLEAHTKYRDTDAFKETIGLLRNKSKGVEMRHVSFKV